MPLWYWSSNSILKHTDYFLLEFVIFNFIPISSQYHILSLKIDLDID